VTTSAVDLFNHHFLAAIIEQQKEQTEFKDTDTWYASGRRSRAYPDKHGEQWWMDNGPEMLEGYVRWRAQTGWKIPSFDGIPAIELPIEVDLGLGIGLRGAVDRVFELPNGELLVWDGKSGERTPESDLQLSIYAVGMEAQYGVRPTYGGYYMARTAQMAGPYELQRLTAPVILDMFQQFLRGVEAKVFLPHVTAMCVSCGVRRACLAYGGPEAEKYDRLAQLTPEEGR